MIENTRKNYKTKQKDTILLCLRDNKGKHVTVDMLMNCLRLRTETVGKTTVYRNLERLVKEGLVLKYDAPDGMGACFQYMEPAEEHTSHYHLLCTKCGTMIHLNCNLIDNLFLHIRKEHRFIPDGLKTILYGQCEFCIEPEKQGRT